MAKKPKIKKQPKVMERKLGREGAVGFAFYEENRIEIDPRQNSFNYFETLIHEKYHFQFPKLEEKEILKLGHDMAVFLWDLHYRRVNLK